MRTDVVQIARDLLGKVLVTRFDGQVTAGMITETEAYRAPDDKASHAWNNRRTTRTEVMFQAGGSAYVYLCYGIHHLFNVVTAPEGMAHAVLIRAVEPLEGLALMQLRRGGGARFQGRRAPTLTTGPGALSIALGLHVAFSGQSLLSADSPVWIEARGFDLQPEQIGEGPRIGVAYAQECAAWPWRFWIQDSLYVKK